MNSAADNASPEADAGARPDDPLVLFMPSGRRGRFPVGTPVLQAARSLGVYIESVCGGRSLCGRCQVSVAEGRFAKHAITSDAANLSPAGESERDYAERRRLKADRRLSCQALVRGDLVIDVPTEAQANRQVVRKRAENRRFPRDPAVRLVSLSVPPPDMEQPLGDADRLLQALGEQAGIGDATIDPALLPGLQAVLRQGDWQVSAAVHQDSGGACLIALWPGEKRRVYGLAVDVGSTTIAVHLIDLASGRTVSSLGSANPQIRFGEDLMSRVSYVMMNPDGLPTLVREVRQALDTMARKLAGDVGAAPEDILDVVLVGNPVMHHLFLGIDPTELGGAPFALAVSDAVGLPARDLGLAINPAARAYVLPCIAGHVGADAAGVALAEGPQQHDGVTLVVDVGTNAEIILGDRTRILAASSPTGPAFEGAEISCGQRAAPGAIERVRIDPETLEPKIRVLGIDAWSDEPEFAEKIGQVSVTGICGSGIIEAVASLFLAGVISADGVVNGALAARSPRIGADERTFRYLLWRDEFDITITQKDIRAIQLAKAALYAGIKLLMEAYGTDRVDRIKLAGAFGSYVDPLYAMVLGLIPDCDLRAVSAVGNAAGTGARMALLNRGYRREVEGLVRRIEKLETALAPRFQEHFVAAMAFPNKRDPFPHLAEAVALPAARPAEEADAPRRRRGRQRNATT